MQRLDEIQACFEESPKIPKIMISGIVILTKSVNLPLLLASPVKDANDMINTAFTLMRRLKYKLNLHSRAQTCSCCLRFNRQRGENISF